MNQYVVSLFPPEFLKRPEYFWALSLAVLFLMMAMFQLFTFEQFFSVVQSHSLPGGDLVTRALTYIIPLIELAALPYLLSMNISTRMRQISRTTVLAVPALWIVVTLWTFLHTNSSTNVGLFGATISVYADWWALTYLALLVISAIVVYRELPPRHHL